MMTVTDRPAKGHGAGGLSPRAARHAAIAYLSEGIAAGDVRGTGGLMFAAIADAMDVLAAEGITPAAALAVISAAEVTR
jgi:hypothetical protein